MSVREYAQEKQSRHAWAQTYLRLLDADNDGGCQTVGDDDHALLWRQINEAFFPDRRAHYQNDDDLEFITTFCGGVPAVLGIAEDMRSRKGLSWQAIAAAMRRASG